MTPPSNAPRPTLLALIQELLASLKSEIQSDLSDLASTQSEAASTPAATESASTPPSTQSEATSAPAAAVPASTSTAAIPASIPAATVPASTPPSTQSEMASTPAAAVPTSVAPSAAVPASTPPSAQSEATSTPAAAVPASVAPSAAVPVSVVPSAVSGVVQPAVPSDNLIDPAQAVNTRVLVAVYDPLVDATTGTHLCEYMHWNRAEDIVHGFMQDITTASAGLAAFTVVQQVDLDEFPVLTDGYSYDAKTYLDLENNVQPAHQPQMADYSAIMNGLNIVSRVDSQDIDEVWLFGFPYAGFYESCMGGAGAFWCNGPVIPGTASCSRRFVVMGLSYERGVGEMLHSFGHRCESILTQTYSKTAGDANLYARFSRYDKTSPGKAELGTVHYPPNALQDYDYDNSTLVPSNCYDWYNFPNFKDDVRQVNASEWGNGDMESLHSWWLKHMPKVAGQTNGIANNWWQYIMNPNLVPD